MFTRVPKAFCKSLQKCEVKWGPLSETMLVGNLCNRTISSMYFQTISPTPSIFFMGIKCADLVSRSMNTQTASFLFRVVGRPVTKSIVMWFHLYSVMGRFCSKPLINWCSTLTSWQVGHFSTHLATSRFIPINGNISSCRDTSWSGRDELRTYMSELASNLVLEFLIIRYTYPTINQDDLIVWCLVLGLVIFSNFAQVLILPWAIQIIVSRFAWSDALRPNGSWSVDNDARSGSFFQALHTPSMLKHQPLSCLMHPRQSLPCPDDKKYLDHNQPQILSTVFPLSLTHQKNGHW